MSVLQRVNIGISIAALTACAAAALLFGWSVSGWKALAIPTGSMRPDIPPGSLVLVHRVPVSSLKVGDVITHINPGDPKMTISHRIVKEFTIGTTPAFITKGDANKFTDAPIVSGDIIGKVVWHAPDLGWGLLNAKNPWIILPIVYSAGLLIMIEEVGRVRDYYKFITPYRVPGFTGGGKNKKPSFLLSKRAGQAASLTALFVVIGAAISPSAFALLNTDTATLADNTVTVKSSSTSCPKKDLKITSNQKNTDSKLSQQQSSHHNIATKTYAPAYVKQQHTPKSHSK